MTAPAPAVKEVSDHVEIIDGHKADGKSASRHHPSGRSVGGGVPQATWDVGQCAGTCFARAATRIGAIVKGERSVTADTALRLARFFGTSAEFWITLQATHDLTKARMESGGTIERDVRPRAA
jgi:plasmid maintenance system antidote protein VapI